MKETSQQNAVQLDELTQKLPVTNITQLLTHIQTCSTLWQYEHFLI